MKTKTIAGAFTFAAASLASLAFADPMETRTFAGPFGVFVSSSNASNTTLSASFTAEGYAPGGVRIMMDLSAVGGAEGTLGSDVIVTVTPPTGDAFDVSMGPPDPFASFADLTQIVPLAVGVNPAGTWTFRIYDSSQQGDGVGAEEFASNVRVSIESASSPEFVTVLEPIADGQTVMPDQFHGAGSVNWFKFVVPAIDDISNPRFLDISTAGQFADSYIGLYDTFGHLHATDDDSGTSHASFLSFGYGGGSTVGGGGPSDFPAISDGRSGKLAAGTYWLAISEYGGGAPQFAPGWRVLPPPEPSGFSYSLTFSLGTTPGGGSLPPAVSVGALPFAPASETLTTGTVEVGATQPGWISFTVGEVSVDAGTYLDISVDPSGPLFDSEIGLYTAGGVLAGIDDDDGLGFTSFLSLGAGGGSTTGDTEITQTVSDGRDGNLTAGTYYLAVGEYNTTFANAFNLTVSFDSEGGGGGTAVVNFRSGVRASEGGCGSADVGVAGGLPGHDGVLDNNDFIAFINHFFNQDPIADMGVAGGLPGSDGQFNNNDFIAFIGHFFAGC